MVKTLEIWSILSSITNGSLTIKKHSIYQGKYSTFLRGDSLSSVSADKTLSLELIIKYRLKKLPLLSYLG